jgi:uncharacterized protein
MMHASSVVAMDRTLGALSKILAKAEAHCGARSIKPEALLGFRMFPDMFPLTRQVQLTCDFAARAAARLAGAEPQAFPDSEETFADLQTRIAAVRAYMASFPAGAYDDAATRDVTIKMRGQEVTMPGLQYLAMYSLPQFHFHAATAYNILRHNGVEVGKGDFMGAN